MANARNASLNGGLGRRPRPSGVQEQGSWWGSGGEARGLKLKAFVNFCAKKWPKVKDLSENLPS